MCIHRFLTVGLALCIAAGGVRAANIATEDFTARLDDHSSAQWSAKLDAGSTPSWRFTLKESATRYATPAGLTVQYRCATQAWEDVRILASTSTVSFTTVTGTVSGSNVTFNVASNDFLTAGDGFYSVIVLRDGSGNAVAYCKGKTSVSPGFAITGANLVQTTTTNYAGYIETDPKAWPRIDSNDADIVLLKTATNHATARLVLLEAATNTVNARIAATEANVTTLQTATNTLQAQATAATASIGTLNTATGTLVSADTALMASNTAVNALIGLLQTETGRLETVDALLAAGTNTLNTRLTTAEGNITSLQTETGKLETADALLTDATNTINVRIAATEVSITALNVETGALEAADAIVRVATNTINQRITESSATVASNVTYASLSGIASNLTTAASNAVIVAASDYTLGVNGSATGMWFRGDVVMGRDGSSPTNSVSLRFFGGGGVNYGVYLSNIRTNTGYSGNLYVDGYGGEAVGLRVSGDVEARRFVGNGDGLTNLTFSATNAVQSITESASIENTGTPQNWIPRVVPAHTNNILANMLKQGQAVTNADYYIFRDRYPRFMQFDLEVLPTEPPVEVGYIRLDDDSNLHLGSYYYNTLLLGGPFLSGTYHHWYGPREVRFNVPMVNMTNSLSVRKVYGDAAYFNSYSQNGTNVFAAATNAQDVATNAYVHATNGEAIAQATYPVATNAQTVATNAYVIATNALMKTTTNLFAGASTTGMVTSAAGDAAKYLKGDGTWDTPAGAGDFHKDGSDAMTGDLNMGGNSITNLVVVRWSATQAINGATGDMYGDWDFDKRVTVNGSNVALQAESVALVATNGWEVGAHTGLVPRSETNAAIEGAAAWYAGNAGTAASNHAEIVAGGAATAATNYTIAATNLTLAEVKGYGYATNAGGAGAGYFAQSNGTWTGFAVTAPASGGDNMGNGLATQTVNMVAQRLILWSNATDWCEGYSGKASEWWLVYWTNGVSTTNIGYLK